MPNWQVSVCKINGIEKSGKARMGLDLKHTLSFANAVSHSMVHLKGLPLSVRRCNGLNKFIIVACQP